MIRRKPKSQEQLQKEKEEAGRMKIFHSLVWSVRKHVSEISGAPLGNEMKSIFFHHILPKNLYPGAMYDTENLILLTPREHETVERFPTYFPKINKRRELLKEKYAKSIKKSNSEMA